MSEIYASFRKIQSYFIQRNEFKSIVNEALMIAAIDLKHQLVLVLKSEHKLAYFNVLLQGEKKICSKRNSHTDILKRIWRCEIVVLYFSIHLSILALRNLCDSNKQAVGTNVEMQDLWDEQRKFTQKQNRLSLPKTVGVWLSRGRKHRSCGRVRNGKQ